MNIKIADRIIAILLLLCLIPFFIPEKAPEAPEEPYELRLFTLGVPYAEHEARYPWDMRAHQGYLYLTAGDFNKNKAPSSLFRMSLDSLTWEPFGHFQDEQAERLLLLDGKLMIPGVDPCEDWSLGNYYTVEENVLTLHRTLPNGIHNFDLAHYEGKLFASLGTEPPHSPLVVSEDGETFTPVDFITQEGKSLLEENFYTARVYDLFVLQGRLYAVLTLYLTEQTGSRIVFRYEEDGRMHFYSNYPSLSSVALHYFPIIGDIEREDFLLFSTGRLHYTEDMRTFTDITPADTRYIVDIVEEDGEIYALGCGIPKGETRFLNNLYRYKEDGTLALVAFFYTDEPPMSFAIEGDAFFVAFGKQVTDALFGEVFYAHLHK